MKKKIDYDNWSKDELIKEIKRIKETTYGLVWHRDLPEEKIDILMNPDARTPSEMFPNEMAGKPFPVLKEVKTKAIETDKNKPTNILIEGDNYHSLAVLNFTHQEAIDLIYIDPPYNTGNDDFIYTDKIKSEYVRSDDPFRHSKWIAFMEKRLKLAKNLLKEDGIIFISIDDNEQAPLKLLCDEIFKEENFISMLVIESGEVFGTKAAHVNKTFVKVKDYVLIYAKNKIFINDKQPLYDGMRELYDSHFNTIIENDLRKISFVDLIKKTQWVKELFEKFNLKINTENINLLMNINEQFKNWVYSDISEKLYADAPLSKKINKSILDSHSAGEPFIFENKIIFKTGTGSVRMFLRFKDNLKASDDFQSSYSRCSIRGDLWKGFHFDMRNVQDEGQIDFKNGKKPVRLVLQLIKWFNKKDITVLDFFAGSGTTAHAVLQLNKLDDGNRKFILCTNNENSICVKKTLPRISNVIKYTKGNLRYFTAYDFVEAKETDRNKRKLVNQSTEMLCIKESAFELVQEAEDFKIFRNHNKYLGIIFHEDSISDYVKAIKKIKGHFNTYTFSMTDDPHKEEFSEVEEKVTLCAIPEVILKVYREIFKE